MGADQAEAYGQRNAVPGELLVRVTPHQRRRPSRHRRLTARATSANRRFQSATCGASVDVRKAQQFGNVASSEREPSVGVDALVDEASDVGDGLPAHLGGEGHEAVDRLGIHGQLGLVARGLATGRP